MEIEKIIYNTTRGIYSIEDKLSITTIILFCYQKDSILFAELLYTDNHDKFTESLNSEYSKFDVNFTIRLDNKNIKECFIRTLEKVKEKYDSNGYYKALFEKDPYAIVINEMINRDFNLIEFKKFNKEVSKQLELSF